MSSYNNDRSNSPFPASETIPLGFMTAMKTFSWFVIFTVQDFVRHERATVSCAADMVLRRYNVSHRESKYRASVWRQKLDSVINGENS